MTGWLLTLLTDLLTDWLTDFLNNSLVFDRKTDYLVYCLADQLATDLVTN